MKMTTEPTADNHEPRGAQTRSKLAWPIHLTGFLSATVYFFLASQSRSVVPVSLAAFFSCIAAVWILLLLCFRLLSHIKCSYAPARTDSEGIHRLIWPVVFWALCFRIIGVTASPILAEDDYFRFMWDGYQFAETGTPYAKTPADFFDEDGLPDPVASLLYDINYPELPTIYGPVMELVFAGGYLIKPASLVVLKCLFVIFEGLLLYFLSSFLNVRWLLAAAWCPLLIFETCFQAHPDIIGVAFMCGAVWASRKEKPWVSMGLLALAACAKPFAILVWPFIVRKNLWFAQGLLLAALLAAIYLPFVFTSGDAGGISLAAMANHWEFNSMGYAVLEELFHQKARAASLFIFLLIYLTLLIRFWMDNAAGRPDQAPFDLVYGTFFFLSPVINPWYLLWLFPFVALKPRAWSIAALVIVCLSYATGLNLGNPSFEEFEIPAWIKLTEVSIIGMGILCSIYSTKKVKKKTALAATCSDVSRSN